MQKHCHYMVRSFIQLVFYASLILAFATQMGIPLLAIAM
jgi:hypothetical protein